MRVLVWLILGSLVLSCSPRRTGHIYVAELPGLSEYGQPQLALFGFPADRFSDFEKRLVAEDLREEQTLSRPRASTSGFGASALSKTKPSHKEPKIPYLQILQACEKQPRPLTIEHLTGGNQVYYFVLEENSAVKLGLLSAAEATHRKRSKLVTYQWVRYLNDFCEVNGISIPIIWGVGAEAHFHIRMAKKSLRITSLPTVAAAVQLDRASVSFQMGTPGLTGPSVEAALPAADSFDVAGYYRVITAVDNVRKAMHEESTHVTPQLLLPKESFKYIKFE